MRHAIINHSSTRVPEPFFTRTQGATTAQQPPSSLVGAAYCAAPQLTTHRTKALPTRSVLGKENKAERRGCTVHLGDSETTTLRAPAARILQVFITGMIAYVSTTNFARQPPCPFSQVPLDNGINSVRQRGCWLLYVLVELCMVCYWEARDDQFIDSSGSEVAGPEKTLVRCFRSRFEPNPAVARVLLFPLAALISGIILSLSFHCHPRTSQENTYCSAARFVDCSGHGE